uniref:Uncharacterized protein n=1 Tax=Globisporangium ultimum (strain ATCC 200006 / CBS 805.95 / DAOM BR144) TaxID=431595 RepID=K3X2T4_GLOUD
MSILWPNGSTKGFAWDKVVPGGGLNGKHSFVTLLAEALRKVDLAHPLAHSTCSILLRPLATLTRTFVTHRVRKLLKKRNSASGTDTVADNSAAVSEPAAPNATGASVSAERTQDVSAHIDLPLSLANEALTAEVTANAEDVAMQSPVSIADDQEMREAVVDEDVNALDEVDEEEFSYLNILDDEALFSEEQTRRARLQRNLEARRGSSRSTSSDSGNAGESSVNSLLEAFLGSPDTTEALTNAISLGEEESPFDSPSGELFRDSIFISQSQDQRGAGTFRNAVMQFIEDLPDGGDENILFESFEMGNAGSRARRDRQGNRAELSGVSITHPLLRSTGSAEVMTDTSGLRVPARLSLPRHSSLLRELQELSEHVQTQLPLSFGGGARARLGGRELLQRGGGRTRPPSRNNRLSAVSNLLSEFSLDIPTSQLSLNQSRSHRLGMRGSDRGDRDIFGGSSRSLRGEGGSANSASLWGPGGAGRNVDIRSVASRLEHRINQMYQDTTEEEPTPTARPENANAQLSDAPTRNDIVGAEEDETRPREDVVLNPDPTVGTPRESEVTASGSSRTSFVGNDEGSVSEDESRSDVATVAGDQTPGNELSSDTASVIALASTFGESTLRSPDEPDTDQMGSETEAPNSPLSHERDVEAQTSSTQFGTLPPPAPVVSESSSMLSFTLDLADLQAPPQRTAPSETQSTRGEMGDDEESKVDDAPTHPPAQDSVAGETTDLVCPEGIDPEVFASLPPDMQAEIVAQSAPPSVSTTAGNQGGSESFSQLDLDMANSSFDRETLEALPEDIRAEVLANERREREALAAAAAAPADISRAQEMDNASFVASLAPELREEILVTCDDAFLQTLPSQVRAEAMILRERAAFRTTYRERQPDAGRSGDGIGDLFQRPTLRRMLTSHGPDGVASSSRRSGRRNVYLDSNGNVRRGSRRDDDDMNGSAHAGMLRVDPDEDEDASERICDDKCVKGLLRLLYMAQSVVQNRVYQRVLANICLYPLTRESVRVNALRVITRALDRPLVLAENVDDNFPPTGLFGCTDNDIRGVKSGQVQHGIPVDAVTRLLHVLVSLAKYNPRFTVELLQPHGMRRQDLFVKSEADLTVTNESGVAVLVELLTVPIVSRNGTNLDTLLELLELVLSPLERLAKKEDANKKDTPENETQPKTNESEWVTVPVINLDARSMSSIVSVLCMDICSPQMQERTVAILKLLNRVPDNCGRVIDAIVYHASALAKTSKASFHGSSYESSAVLRSAQDELRLLRLLHTLSDICETTAAFTDYCHTIGLDPLWDQLSHSLEDARSKGGLDEKDGPVLSPLESVVAAAAAAPSTSDDENVDGMVIEGKSAGASCAMAALLARFLPMVEAFFVVNARDAASMSLQIPDSTEREEAFVANLRVSGFASTNTASTSVETPASPTPTPSEAGESMRLANFVEANRVLLNIL